MPEQPSSLARTTPRASRPEVRNPIMALPHVSALRCLPPEAREGLIAILKDLGEDASKRAEGAWRARKAPMACYWRAVSTYARHLARATA